MGNRYNQKIDDENPSLPKPIFIESNVYILNNEGSLFKINGETGKIIWKKIIFLNLENTIIGTPALSGKIK
jgi:outer membrane protein assembly factor BamB